MREKSIIKKNIMQYLDSKGISKYEFYQKTGVSNGVLSQGSGMSEENILRFLNYYDDISPEWLLTGKGSMVRRSNEDEALRLRITELEELNDLLRFKISVLEEAAERVKKEKKID
ncbi:MAG: hypothetical protein H3C36_02100 [Chitinophagaceae bacterium]|nr:hypothetical protein [Chitinophagaceae bacterium]